MNRPSWARQTTLIGYGVTVLTATCRGGEVGCIAAEIGLWPEHLAAAGFGTGEVEVMLTRIQDAEELRAQLTEAAAQVEISLQLVNEMTVGVSDNPGDGELIEQLEEASAALSSAQSSEAALRTDLFSCAVDGFDEGKVAALNACSVQAFSALPPEMRVVVWSDEDRDGIETASSIEADAAADGEEVDPQAAIVLSESRANSDVIAAAEGLQEEKADLEELVEHFDDP